MIDHFKIFISAWLETNGCGVMILLGSHDAVDDKVGATVEDEAKVLEGCQCEHPAGEGGDEDEKGKD